MALVAITRCHVSASTSSSGASGDTPVEYRSASMPPMASTASPHQLAAPLGIGDVGGDRGPGAGAGHDLGQLLRAAADHRDPGAGLGRGQGRAASDAGGATDDEDPLPGEVDVDVLAAHGQATSSTSAEPMPPPAHIETTPWVAPRRRSSLIMVTTMRAPVRGDRVAEAATAAVDVDDVGVDAERADRGDRHRAERLVDLEQVDVVDRQAGRARAPSGWPASAPCRCGPARGRTTPTTRRGPTGAARGPRRSRPRSPGARRRRR